MITLTGQDGVLFDIRYATANNLMGRPVYQRAVAMLHPQAYGQLMAVVARAAAIGLQVKIFDAFRPQEVQWIFWEAAADKLFVADPRLGGTHPRGIAVDMTLVDAATGVDLPMGTDFDAMVPLSAHGALEGLAPEVIRNRALLLGLMAAAGWEPYEPEWWHYNLPGREAFPVLSAADVPGGPV
jgi:D-alanyl-D-alanine dipeptidase